MYFNRVTGFWLSDISMLRFLLVILINYSNALLYEDINSIYINFTRVSRSSCSRGIPRGQRFLIYYFNSYCLRLIKSHTTFLYKCHEIDCIFTWCTTKCYNNILCWCSRVTHWQIGVYATRVLACGGTWVNGSFESEETRIVVSWSVNVILACYVQR